MREHWQTLSAARRAGTLLGLAGLAGGWAAGMPALGLALLAICWWTAEPVPVDYSSLLILVLIPAFGLLTLPQTLAPFAGSAVWLIFAGMVLSLGITATGLEAHLAGLALRRLGRSPGLLLLQLHLLGLAAAFLVPSGVVRVLLLLPIGIALVDGLGGRDNPRLNAAVLLSLVCSTYYGGTGLLTGAMPNLVVAGQLERVSGRTLFWGEWCQWMFPVMGLLRTALSLGVIYLLFGRHLPRSLRSATSPPHKPLDPTQRQVLGLLVLGVGLWASDALHHLAPVYVGLVLVALYTAPGWGPLPFASLRQLNFPFLFYIAALFSLGAALEAAGLDQIFITWVRPWLELEAHSPVYQHLALTVLAVPLNFLMDNAAVASLLTPPLLELGRGLGLAELPIALSVGMAAGQVFFPYQCAPFMLAYSFRRLGMGQIAVCMIAIAGLTLLLLCPLNVWYWHWLGLI
ncbi:MAG: anion permease [Candidatus Handelsmanbacteria bacterium]|nr:anion permease [Candidatus Handelsmanbacteria bacterium]